MSESFEKLKAQKDKILAQQAFDNPSVIKLVKAAKEAIKLSPRAGWKEELRKAVENLEPDWPRT